MIAAVDDSAAHGKAILADLVRTRGLSGSEGTTTDALSVVGKVFAAAKAHGTEVEAQPVAPGSENVIEILRGAPGRAFVIEAHTDTVDAGEPARWHDANPYSGAEGFVEYLGGNRVGVEVGSSRYEAQIRPRMSKVWEGYRTDRRRRILYGRGSFDNKGSVVSALLAMGALAHATSSLEVELRGSVIAAYTVDEEDGASGVQRFAAATDSWLATNRYLSGSVDADGMHTGIAAVALDGSYGWVPVVGHRGGVQLAIRTRGRSAHAATPELGVNAVEAMSRIVVALADGQAAIAARLASSLETSLLGSVTLAVGTTIAGGGVRSVRMGDTARVERTSVNAIPDWCEATVDIRFPQGRRYPADLDETKALVVDAVKEHIDARVDRHGWSYEVKEISSSWPVAMAPTLDEAAALPLVDSEIRRAAQILGRAPDLETAPGGTDATFMIHGARIPTMVELGPAGGLSHDVHEFVELDSVIDGAKILALMAIDQLGVEA
ncbi:MAG TPA: M20 family metallopeptidase [Candidatus Dormibacteraeota bacterium]|nr:M20 family metallopeptidase [Candidatus Dormibacteraeota bacterium]